MVENGGRQGIMDYALLPKRVLGRLLDEKAWRGEDGGMSDHILVEAQSRNWWVDGGVPG